MMMMMMMSVYFLLVLIILNINITKSFYAPIKRFNADIDNYAAKKNIPHIYNPKTEGQIKYNKLVNDDDIKLLVSLGPAGTGKTLFACQKAIIDLKSEKINKIIITRPVITFEEDIGFLPGNLIKKMDPWTRPIFDIFSEFYQKSELDNLIKNGKVEICPLVFMRGRTFKNSFIIADEMQNSTPNQMKMLTTRIGDDSRMIITGDLKQTDINTDSVNGLRDFIIKFNNLKKKTKIEQDNNNDYHYCYEKEIIRVHYMNSQDIERSKVVKQIINIYDEL
jgi:phosphate starvation-inducible PhoH-like protein